MNEKKILTYLSSAQGQAAFCDLRTGPHLTLQQLLHAFPSSKPPLEALCGVLNQLMPRFYSLSNDPHVSSAREGLAGRRLIEMAVTVHESPADNGSKRTGVGSGFLERIAHKFIEAERDAQEVATQSKILLSPRCRRPTAQPSSAHVQGPHGPTHSRKSSPPTVRWSSSVPASGWHPFVVLS